MSEQHTGGSGQLGRDGNRADQPDPDKGGPDKDGPDPPSGDQSGADQLTDQPGSVPHRELRDPTVLRALSHPVRLRIFDELATIGQATATEMAARIGESPANCSWHLRQLAQHGFVEEAGGGTGRQRPWRVVIQSTSIGKPGEDEEPEFATARDTLVEVLMGQEVERWRAWQAARHAEPPQWREASLGTQTNGIWLTVEELAAFKSELQAVTERHLMLHVERFDPANRPEGSRPVRFVGWAFPSGPPHHRPDPQPDHRPDPQPDPESPDR